MDRNGAGRYELVYFKYMIKGMRDIHSQGIVHRDVKPENIFVHGPRLKIGDFGLSKLVRRRDTAQAGTLAPHGYSFARSIADLTRTFSLKSVSTTTQGAVIGTPSYAAPEGGVACTEKADIYSCGLVLVELLSHKMTTAHERHQLLGQYRERGILPAYFQHDAFAGWRLLINRMCARLPTDRPSAETVVQVLKQCAVNVAGSHYYELDSAKVHSIFNKT
ncbi:putative protein kinase [Gregarina niphandrodes]|uniref:non-specific serine/threonine protein kinase n=1 Tax=Gregarina niphandrodes TaxID=110365 RepID=A0A023B601_GRENI|nr:putative protein kinase [Gregarina niphandrodes]EZG64345.1 putative protein kinase [Gregarina niphandrodes]|eukprot:XP_011130641.1 putative protein kinase [Gregarina niphandrodes]